MKNEAIEYRADLIDQFRSGAWYTPRDGDRRWAMRHWLLSLCGASTFAAVMTTLVRFLGG